MNSADIELCDNELCRYPVLIENTMYKALFEEAISKRDISFSTRYMIYQSKPYINKDIAADGTDATNNITSTREYTVNFCR